MHHRPWKNCFNGHPFARVTVYLMDIEYTIVTWQYILERRKTVLPWQFNVGDCKRISISVHLCLPGQWDVQNWWIQFDLNSIGLSISLKSLKRERYWGLKEIPLAFCSTSSHTTSFLNFSSTKIEQSVLPGIGNLCGIVSASCTFQRAKVLFVLERRA